ncbi:hypothetical protein [Kerstersia gyiorum]|uniref:hypothetical protein n=1 Tax=Kerstersia gyiorum TaxID=206506 RepID=UPI00187C7D34|nr:hypothetical protein [Kerstersia gyiorum]MCP1636829.1 hypothetical protein [Kerstersia gyiorum]MCP1671555.1 hypothetical protein [Kerstersia gyiorum]MCP1677517.1 hypothetical protein [Kerstersia gyiorum]MCP1709363.1 hypothetical protein [Kerstersia gyiorum]MCP1712036.1 hypothetical protein [Kerstersia gyiorum]
MRILTQQSVCAEPVSLIHCIEDTERQGLQTVIRILAQLGQPCVGSSFVGIGGRCLLLQLPGALFGALPKTVTDILLRPTGGGQGKSNQKQGQVGSQWLVRVK